MGYSRHRRISFGPVLQGITKANILVASIISSDELYYKLRSQTVVTFGLVMQTQINLYVHNRNGRCQLAHLEQVNYESGESFRGLPSRAFHSSNKIAV